MAAKKVNNPKAYIICDQRRVRKDKTAPIRLIVKHESKQKVYGLDLYLTKADFKQTRQKNFSGNLSEEKQEELRPYKVRIEENEKKVKDILNSLPLFTFEEFEDRMFGSHRDTLFTALEAKIADMMKQGRVGNASTYVCTLNTMRLFRGGIRTRDGRSATITGGEDIRLSDVTVNFLREFEDWYVKLKKRNGSSYSPTTVGIYIRNIRVLLNDAIANKLFDKDIMPIGKRKYRIPGSRKRKFALNLEQIGKIYFAEMSPGSQQEMYRDYFMFSYLASGMNMADLSRLQYADIDSEKISYIRAKTAFKKLEDPEFITVPLTVQLAKIIDKWGNKPAFPNTYVFPILTPQMNALDEFKAVKAAVKRTNTVIKKIADILEIDGNISFYTGRHSYATILRNAGVSVQAISENLGHSSPKITQDYLDDFEISEKRLQAEHLLPKK